MSRYFTLYDDWYGDDIKIFKKNNIEIKTGVTILVGCNGAGKTTLLHQIKQSLENKNIPVLLHDNKTQGERRVKDYSVFSGNFEMVARLLSSSEGENIVNVLGDVARKMGGFTKEHSDSNEIWFLFDAIDSGLSIDNVIDIKEQLIPIVIEHNSDKDIYFVISANSYECARNENCLDVINGEYIRFKDYEEYREFILKSKKQKLERYD
jgi:energy-coupling factor transporter ATP-binding protein EcfA2